MVNLITGPKGTGKTQQMIELANEKVKTSIHNIFRASRKLLPSSPNPHNHYLIQTKSSQRQPGKRTDTLYLWPRSKV